MDEEELGFSIGEEEEEGNALLDFFLRWLPLMIPLAVIGGVFGFLYFRTLPKVYQAETTVLAEIKAQRVLKETGDSDTTAGNYSTYNTREFFATQMQVLKSKDLADRVQLRLKLNDKPNWRKGLGKLNGKMSPSQLIEATQSRLRRGFSVDRQRYARVIHLSFSHFDPRIAAEVVTTFAEEYVAKSASQRTVAQKRAHLWLQSEEKRLRAELGSVGQEIDTFKRSQGLLSADTENSRNLRWGSLERLQREADRLRILGSKLQEELSALKSMDAFGRAAAIMQANSEPTPLKLLQSSLMAAQAQLAKDRARYNDEHPVIHEDRQRLAALISSRDSLVSADIQATTAKFEGVRKQRVRLLAALQNGRDEVLSINSLERGFKRLDARRGNLEKLLTSVSDQLLTTGMAVRLDTNNVQILDHASVPMAPVGPNGKLITLAGLIFGVILGAVIGLITELAQSTLQGPEQVRRMGQLALIGVVDNMRRPSDAPDLAVALQPRSNLAEQFRSIRSNLLFMRVDAPLRTLSITSPSPKDGKTFNAVSLAVTMAQAGKRVLIIDTDLRRGRLHRVFERENEKGVVDVLTRQASIKEACQGTDVENLSLLSSGVHPPNPAELLHSEAFRNMRDRLLEEFDLLVFDTPPVNLVTDAVILANCTDGLILVVREGQTSKRDLAMCVERLRTGRAKVMGFIFNGQRQGGGAYGSRYGYRRYGYYGRYRSYSPYYGYQSYGIEES
ncbi:MAG: polysaccharide biosynthesis tyrosine autokinase [Myxococcota bacterium]|nr:polysaccharide biosynthesis tyrosine autokinase [Myxococcota bacterium]